MSDDAAGPAALKPTTPHASPTALVIAWCLGAGFFLLLAPALAPLWERVVAGDSALEQFGATEAARIGVSAVGLLLLMVGSWDLATAIVERWTR